MSGRVRFGPLGPRCHLDMPLVPVACRRLPQAFEGFRIALAADLHFGLACRPQFVRALLRRVQRLEPDLVLLCGDTVEDGRKHSVGLGELLRPFARRLRMCAVLGNHEAARGSETFRAAMAAAGVDVLVNEHRVFRRGGAAIAVVGLDDLKFGRPDLRAASAGLDEGTFVVLAGHHPDLVDAVGPEDRVDLMLCGHTHGGQVCLLGRPLVTYVEHKQYVSGLLSGPGFPLYVSRGLGYTRLPLRIDAEPELPLIVLRTTVGRPVNARPGR